MIDLYFAATPNGQKMKLFFEETGLPYRVMPISISKGEQFAPEFLKVSPNNKIPAIVDHAPADGGAPLAMFESGAILLYLADKSGQLIPKGFRERLEAIQWLFWQVGGLGPMAGQNGHFATFAPEPVPYAIERYQNETERLYCVLNKQLQGRAFIAGDYSIADIACYPWIVPHEAHGQELADFPDLKRWFDSITARPATVRAYEGVKTTYTKQRRVVASEEREALFGKHVVKPGASTTS